MVDSTAKFAGDIPKFYDEGLGPTIFVDYAADMAERVAAAKPRRVLETAAGTGIVTRALRDKLPAETALTATDLNPDMLAVARHKFPDGKAVTLQPADALALPFPDASFDAMVCQFGIMFYPGKDKGYREALRVLTPGGRYFFSVWDSHRHNPYARIGHEVIGSFFKSAPPQFYRVPFSCNEIDPIKEALPACGFTDIDIGVLSRRKQIPDARAFARGMVFGNPVIAEIKARGGVSPEAVVDAVTDALHREFGNPGTMPMQAIFFSATKP